MQEPSFYHRFIKPLATPALSYAEEKRLSFMRRIGQKTRTRYVAGIVLDITLIIAVLVMSQAVNLGIISPISNSSNLQSLNHGKSGNEVFGFAPYWNLSKMDNVDFNVLTTFAYFGIPVNADGTFDTYDPGYAGFYSQQATDLFKKAHSYGTRVVLTLSQMDDESILELMDNPTAQDSLIQNSVQLVKDRGIDGINVDFEYMGDPGESYREKFSSFIQNLSTAMHRQVPASHVTVSVYASAVKDPKIYDLHSLSASSDGIFMMAYDFAVAGSENAMPTDPLYGASSGKYWYDVSTAVNDFLTEMPANKLILGVPYYGYNYMVYSPTVKAETRPASWRGSSTSETYSYVEGNVPAQVSGWDSEGEVGYKAYYDAGTGTWRMVFEDDARSLSLKYDFAKTKKLAGVGMWALGNDDGHSELWTLLADKFGNKLADSMAERRVISD